ncbi:MAG: periplasmic heavy metal sensor [Pseudomonadota bacterium]
MNADQAQKTSNWVRVALIVSLALNFVFVGLAAGAAFKVKSGATAREFGRLGGPVLVALPPEMRERLRDELRSQRDLLQSVRGRVLTSDGEITAALRSDPFDEEAFRQALINRGEAVQGAMTAVNGPLVEIMSELSSEERAALADLIEERSERVKRTTDRLVKPGAKAD